MTNLTATHLPGVLQSSEDAPRESLLGGAIAIRLRSEQTDGRVAMLDYQVPAGFPGPPLHVHPDFDETFYILDGSLTLRIDDQVAVAGPGTIAFVPRGTRHTFANPNEHQTRILVMLNPAGFERYFEELIAAVRVSGRLPAPDELAELGIAHGSVPA
jgi:mannose-6-phosphate isomerase-like protein (cupin superfamily)